MWACHPITSRLGAECPWSKQQAPWRDSPPRAFWTPWPKEAVASNQMTLSLRFWQRCRYQFFCIVFWRCAELLHCQQQLASASSWKHFRRIPLSADFRDFVPDLQWMSNWCPGKLDDSRIWTWQVEVRSSHTLPTPTSCASWTWGSSPSFATWGLQRLQSCSVVLLETGDNHKNVDVQLGNRQKLVSEVSHICLISDALPHS